MVLKKEMELYITLGQVDGRLIPGSKHPYKDIIHNVMFSIFNADDGADTIDSFDPKRIAKDIRGKKAMSKIMEYKDISHRLTLKPGSYIIVPSTKTAGDYGKYFLNIYFSKG